MIYIYTRNSAYFSISSLPGDIPPLVSTIAIRLTQQQCKKKWTKKKFFRFTAADETSVQRDAPVLLCPFFLLLLLLNDDQSYSAVQDYSTVYKCSCWRESTWSFAKSASLSQDVYSNNIFEFLVWFFLCNCAAL